MIVIFTNKMVTFLVITNKNADGFDSNEETMKYYIYLIFISLLFSTNTNANSLVIKHEAGTTTINKKPNRVVVIGVAALDVLDRFNIQPIAVNKGPYLPDYLKKYKSDEYISSGSLFEPNYEAIYTAKPDLIITGIRSARHFDALSKIAPTIIYSVDSTKGYWTSTKREWTMIGNIFEISDLVSTKIQEIESKISVLSDDYQSQNLRALTIMSMGNNITNFGADSRFSSIYVDFGFQEAVSAVKKNTHGDIINYEFIYDTNPDVIFVIDRDKLKSTETQTQTKLKNSLVKRTNAYKNNKIVYLNLNAWYIASGGVTATEVMIHDLESVDK